MPSNLCKCLAGNTEEKGERNAGLPGLQAISLLSPFPPIANKWAPITRRLQSIGLDSGCIFWEDLVLCQHLPQIGIPVSFYFILFFSKRRALINGVCLAVVIFTSINTLLLTVSSCDFIPKLAKFKPIWALGNTVCDFPGLLSKRRSWSRKNVTGGGGVELSVIHRDHFLICRKFPK